MPSAGALPRFDCPNCQAVYRVVEAEAGPESSDDDVPCRRCGGILPGRKGEYVLKYFYATAGATRRQDDVSLAPAIHHASERISAAYAD
jgi:predicted Zn finger-like uncharacterized protein